jgi:hypothetical protein
MHKDERVTDAMVEAACAHHWPGSWPGDRPDNILAVRRADIRAALTAADEVRRAALASAEEEKAAVNDRLIAFAKECFEEAWQGGDLSGDHIQDLGVRFGLLSKTKFDPEKHNDPDGIAEAGDTWYEYTDAMSAPSPASMEQPRSALVDVPAVEQEPVGYVNADFQKELSCYDAAELVPNDRSTESFKFIPLYLHPPRSALVVSPEAGETAPKPKKRVKLPPLSDELYEHYPSMSAQTHAELVRDYARAALSRNSSTEETVGDAITAKGDYTKPASDYNSTAGLIGNSTADATTSTGTAPHPADGGENGS